MGRDIVGHSDNVLRAYDKGEAFRAFPPNVGVVTTTQTQSNPGPAPPFRLNRQSSEPCI